MSGGLGVGSALPSEIHAEAHRRHLPPVEGILRDSELGEWDTPPIPL